MVEIRRFVREDVERVQELAADRAVAEFTRIPFPYPPDGARAFFAKAEEERRAGTGHVFAVVAGGELVGLCGLRDRDAEKGSAELGYWIGRPHWGRGHASAAAALLVAWGFEELGLASIHARCLERNPASARVLEKLGFRPVSRQRNPYPKWRPDDIIVSWELDRAGWRGGAGAARFDVGDGGR